MTWSLLFLNALTFYPDVSFIHIPSIVGKGIQQGSLFAAFLMALAVNRRLILRPNVFLLLVTLLPIEALVTSLDASHLGTVYRTLRLVAFVVILWLLTPWWGRRDLLIARCHLFALSIVLGSVVIGLVASPGHALAAGRLTGALWPIPPTEVAHYAAILIGLIAVLWLCGHLRGPATAIIVAAASAILILTHTRTALVGLVAGLLVAGLSLIVAKARVRRAFAVGAVTVATAITTLSSFIATWLARGEGTAELADLTGRTKVWGPLLALPRDKFQVLFGSGLSNDSFNGLPIDSNWLASYSDQGLFGVVLCAAIIMFLLVVAWFQPRGVRRALALFLITYCIVASFTEVGFTQVSPYLLDLTVAASLLVPFRSGSR
jgi:hypothetical protein